MPVVVVVVGPVVFVGCCALPGVGVLTRTVELPVVLCCVVRLFFVSVLIVRFFVGAGVSLFTLVVPVVPVLVVLGCSGHVFAVCFVGIGGMIGSGAPDVIVVVVVVPVTAREGGVV